MAFIVKKNINGKDYYYLNENKREGDKVKTKTIAYLGKTKKDAKKKMKEILKNVSFEKRSVSKKNEEQINENKSIKDKKINEVKLDNLNHPGQLTDKKEMSANKNEQQIQKLITIDELANFCKQKGFVFRSSDIYGGFSGFWDFGPLGIELFNNIKRDWWDFFVLQKENMVGIDASILSHPRIWKASGHIENFNDVAVICKKCKNATKIDKSEVGKVKCDCGGEYDVKGEFSLMFKTSVGVLNPSEAYLRGETAQGMFTDFKLIQQTSRIKLPFGIAQIGKCFRNEIAPRDFLFRSREFTIGEFEFFIAPQEDDCQYLDKEHLNAKLKILDKENQTTGKNELRETTISEILNEKRLGNWHAYWLAEQILWLNSIGLKEIKIREHTKEELSHYSSATFDIDYEYPFGSKEIAGNANRGQYDLTQHQTESKQSMEIFDEKHGKVLPKVIEPTFGMERIFLAVLTKAYSYDSKRDYVILKIPPKLSPIKASIFPIIKKPEFEKISRKVFDNLKKEFHVSYDESGSIGRRYARNDEIGTPMTITVDDKTLEDDTVTIRDRDTAEQVRIKIEKLSEIVKKVINGEDLLKLGKPVNTRKK